MSQAAIQVSGLSYTYSDGRTAIRDVDFELEPGESVGVIGPNGAGKTTLFRLLAGLLEPETGTIRVLGKRYTEVNGNEIRRHLGIVFQETEDQLFSPTVYEDVVFGPLNFGLDKKTVETAVAEALESVGLAGFEDRVPHHLSSGERRRVALATVLAYRPDILILDEPTSDLDPRGQRELVGLLERTSQARLVASHDLEFVLRACDRVLLLDAGRIEAAGPTAEVLTDATLLEKHGLACPLGWCDMSAEALRTLIRDEHE